MGGFGGQLGSGAGSRPPESLELVVTVWKHQVPAAGSRRPETPDFVAVGSMLFESIFVEFLCRRQTRRTAASEFEVKPLKGLTEAVDGVDLSSRHSGAVQIISCASRNVPAVLLAQRLIVPKVLVVEHGICRIHSPAIIMIPVSRSDEGRGCML
jgi:hypothetical protein